MADDAVMIRDLPEDERPREKMNRYGASALGNPELLAIILRVGNARMSAVQLGQHLLAHFGGLRELAAASVPQLSKVKGIGLAKACQLKAAFELGKRLAATTKHAKPIITGAEIAADVLMEQLRYHPEEHFHVMFLDARNQIIANRDIFVGTLNASLVHPREVFHAAITLSAGAVLLAHNHPSGDPTPSKEDLALTARMVDAGAIVGIPVLDHVIIGDGVHVSLRERGLMK